MRRAVSQWLSRPLSRRLIYLLVPLFCLLPVWLMAGPLLNYHIQADDFYHFGASRTWDRTVSNLFRPHNLHLVTVFRVVNWCVFRLAGGWQLLPRVASASVIVLLVLVMTTCARLVSRETGSAMLGLASMVGIGGSTLLYSAVTFYAASPALWAAFGILLTLVSLQRWRRLGGIGSLIAAGLAGLMAIVSWSGGYVVGPVAAVYLWMDGRPASRRVALCFLFLAAACSGGLFLASRNSILSAENLGGHAATEAIRPVRGFVHTMHAIPEMLVLRNLGINAEITESQGVVLCLLLAGLWVWHHRRGVPITPLEAAGATCALVSYLLIYTARGYLPFSSLRTTPWYQTLPHVGAVLFVCGLVSNARSLPESNQPVTLGGIFWVSLFALVVWAVQKPLAKELFRSEVFPTLSSAEAEQLVLPESFRHDMAWLVAGLTAQEQRQLFAQFDRIEALSQQFGITAGALRDEFGNPHFTGLPVELDPWEILQLADEPAKADPETVRQALGWIEQMKSLPHLALRPLLESLQRGDTQTRIGAAIALGMIGRQAEPAVPMLLERLRDSDPLVQINAALALKRIDPRMFEKLGFSD